MFANPSTIISHTATYQLRIQLHKSQQLSIQLYIKNNPYKLYRYKVQQNNINQDILSKFTDINQLFQCLRQPYQINIGQQKNIIVKACYTFKNKYIVTPVTIRLQQIKLTMRQLLSKSIQYVYMDINQYIDSSTYNNNKQKQQEQMQQQCTNKQQQQLNKLVKRQQDRNVLSIQNQYDKINQQIDELQNQYNQAIQNYHRMQRQTNYLTQNTYNIYNTNQKYLNQLHQLINQYQADMQIQEQQAQHQNQHKIQPQQMQDKQQSQLQSLQLSVQQQKPIQQQPMQIQNKVNGTEILPFNISPVGLQIIQKKGNQNFQIKKNNIIHIGIPNQGNQIVINYRMNIGDHNYFQIKIKKTMESNIYIGVVDLTNSKKRRSNELIAYYGGDGEIWDKKPTTCKGKGFKQGDIVEVRLRSMCISWIVNGTVQAEYHTTLFRSQNRSFYPIIQMGSHYQCVKWITV